MASWTLAGERQATRIRKRYLKAILRQDIGYFDVETSTGEVVGRMTGDTLLIQDAMSEKVRIENSDFHCVQRYCFSVLCCR